MGKTQNDSKAHNSILSRRVVCTEAVSKILNTSIIVQFQKISFYPPRRELLSQTPTPGISILHCRGCVSQSPTPWNLVEYPLENIFVSKIQYLLHYIIMQKIIFFCEEMRKKISFMLIRCLIISRTSLANCVRRRRTQPILQGAVTNFMGTFCQILHIPLVTPSY